MRVNDAASLAVGVTCLVLLVRLYVQPHPRLWRENGHVWRNDDQIMLEYNDALEPKKLRTMPKRSFRTGSLKTFEAPYVMAYYSGRNHNLLDVLSSPLAPSACAATGGRMMYIGTFGDGKWICLDADVLEGRSEHHVVSLGSDNNFGFEASLLEMCLTCVVHVFDCFPRGYGFKAVRSIDWAGWKSAFGARVGRAVYHNICVGTAPPPDDVYDHSNEVWMPYNDVIAKFELDVDLLKIDIEGSEWELLKSLATFPPQIAVEVHNVAEHASDVLALSKTLRNLRFQTIVRTDSICCPEAAELVFLRV